MRELTGTDVKWMAKGYWDSYFNWKIHPKAKIALVISGVALAALVILAIASASIATANPEAVQTPSPLFPLGMVFLLTFAGAFLWAVFVLLKERDTFLDAAVHLWETEGLIPDRTTVVDFIKPGRQD